MSTDGISALERGHRRSPQRETLSLLADALALDAEARKAFEASARSSAQRRVGGNSVAVGPWPPEDASNLPWPIASFVGRETELREIGTLLSIHRLVTVTGVGGVGKTQTALRLARALSSDLTGGSAYFVTLAPVNSADSVLTAIASAFGVQAVPNRPLINTLLAYLRNKKTLLILDNCEHVIEAAASIAEALLSGCPQLRVLATSREPLMAAGERRYRLASLKDDEAIALFVDRAQAVDLHFDPSAEEAPIVSEICRKLDGIPLAIELAATRLSVISLTTLRERLDERLTLLTRGRRTAMPAQQTMRAAIDWSYDLLSTREQQVFERLSVFAGGCALAAATAVCGGDGVAESDVLDLLASLVDKSLLTVDPKHGEPRYILLESFRQYAREKLAARKAFLPAVRSHAVAYLDLAESMGSSRRNLPTTIAHTIWLAEQENFRVALQWALVEHGDVPIGQRLAGEVSYWEFFPPRERQHWMEVALDLIDDRTPPKIIASLHRANAVVAFHQRKFEASLGSAEIALKHYRALDDSLGIVQVQNARGYALENLRRIAEARAVFEETLPLARASQSRTALAGILAGLALVTDDIELVRRYLTEAKLIHEASGNKVGVTYALAILGSCEEGAGNVDLAIARTTDALEEAAALPAFASANLTALTLQNLCEFLIGAGRYDQAEQRAHQLLDLGREYVLDQSVATSMELLAALAMLRPRATVTAEAPARAARVLGFVDEYFAAIAHKRYETSKPRYEHAVSALQSYVGAERVTQLMADGALLSQEEAIAEALRL